MRIALRILGGVGVVILSFWITLTILRTGSIGFGGKIDRITDLSGVAGDYISASLPARAPVSLTSGNPATIVSTPIAAGDWDVACNIVFTANASTAVNLYAMAPTGITNALPAQPAEGFSLIQYNSGVGPGTNTALSGGTARFNLASGSTVYCAAQAFYRGEGSAVSAYGLIRARRMK